MTIKKTYIEEEKSLEESSIIFRIKKLRYNQYPRSHFYNGVEYKDILKLMIWLSSEFNYDLPASYISILRETDGFEINSVVLYSIENIYIMNTEFQNSFFENSPSLNNDQNKKNRVVNFKNKPLLIGQFKNKENHFITPEGSYQITDFYDLNKIQCIFLTANEYIGWIQTHYI